MFNLVDPILSVCVSRPQLIFPLIEYQPRVEIYIVPEDHPELYLFSRGLGGIRRSFHPYSPFRRRREELSPVRKNFTGQKGVNIVDRTRGEESGPGQTETERRKESVSVENVNETERGNFMTGTEERKT